MSVARQGHVLRTGLETHTRLTAPGRASPAPWQLFKASSGPRAQWPALSSSRGWRRACVEEASRLSRCLQGGCGCQGVWCQPILPAATGRTCPRACSTSARPQTEGAVLDFPHGLTSAQLPPAQLVPSEWNGSRPLKGTRDLRSLQPHPRPHLKLWAKIYNSPSFRRTTERRARRPGWNPRGLGEAGAGRRARTASPECDVPVTLSSGPGALAAPRQQSELREAGGTTHNSNPRRPGNPQEAYDRPPGAAGPAPASMQAGGCPGPLTTLCRTLTPASPKPHGSDGWQPQIGASHRPT